MIAEGTTESQRGRRGEESIPSEKRRENGTHEERDSRRGDMHVQETRADQSRVGREDRERAVMTTEMIKDTRGDTTREREEERHEQRGERR